MQKYYKAHKCRISQLSRWWCIQNCGCKTRDHGLHSCNFVSEINRLILCLWECVLASDQPNVCVSECIMGGIDSQEPRAHFHPCVLNPTVSAQMWSIQRPVHTPPTQPPPKKSLQSLWNIGSTVKKKKNFKNQYFLYWSWRQQMQALHINNLGFQTYIYDVDVDVTCKHSKCPSKS